MSKARLLLASERRAIVGLAGLYATRMLGLFMVLPVLALNADHLVGATPLLVGLALGVYGLTQAVLQIPFGLLSDRIGRKPVIAAGLGLFLIGSVVAAQADSIAMMIVGRSLQGSGAVAAAIMALLADQTREQVRTAAMATIGLSIGVAFGVAMVLGPLVASHFGLAGVFYFTALLAALGIYGVVAQVVGRRTRELGIRMALGAERGAVLRLVLSQGAILVAVGLVAGLAGAALAGRWVRGLLFQVAPADPGTWLGAVGLLAAASLLATWLPARRATHLDPLTALRED